MNNETLVFGGFIIVILAFLFIDLKLVGKNSHVISFREALGWTMVWVTLAMVFYVFLRLFGDILHDIDSLEDLTRVITKFHTNIDITGLPESEAIAKYNRNLSLEYLTGYIIEYSLSVDNVFIILMIFISFNVPEKYYKRVLFWGILGAVVMRFIFIFLLSALINRFDWILYLFGFLLLYTSYTMFMDFYKHKEQKIDTEHHPMVRFASKYFNLYPKYVGDKFWLRENGKLFVTPLFLVLLVIEFSDVIFAVDSVPAIFAVTKDPYIVFFSNVFAILGLRSMFFLVAGLMEKFYLLKLGLSVLLAFIGVKMMIHSYVAIDTRLSLLIILLILASSVIGSLLLPPKGARAHKDHL